MFSTPPETRPDPPLTVCHSHGKRGGRPLAVDPSDPIHALPDVDTFTAVVWEPTLPAMPEHAEQREFRSFLGHRPTVGGRRGWVCGTVENMDVFYEPPWMGSRRVPQTRTRRPKPGTLAAQGCSPICVKQPGNARHHVSCVHVLHRGRGERWELAVDNRA